MRIVLTEMRSRLPYIDAAGRGARPDVGERCTVDHDVALSLGICDLIYVLVVGKMVARRSPAIRGDRAVADAYLGGVHTVEVSA